MPLENGARIGSYEIVGPLGQGGMGEVYRAHDTRLGRTVALKIIPDAFATDRERVSRFEREARVLASLNHVNIATLYGLEQSDGRHFLAMELVEGDTLAERIARGPLTVADSLTIAYQIAEALEAAHEKGIIHRDLKPANVKIAPDGKVKVLDFGLAKALAPPAHADVLSSPTISIGATFGGNILGTAAYMSPEQARGENTDERSDIFAFGCVLYEMLVGRRSFPGNSVTEAIASVLAREADMTALPANASPKIHDLLRRCLEKEPRSRWQAIGDVRVELDAIKPDPHGLKLAQTAAVAVQPLWKRAWPAAATGLVAAAVTAGVAWSLRPVPRDGEVTRFSFTLPKDQSYTRTGRHVLTVSPDGTNVVYVANNQLYLKPMADMASRPIPGTAQDINTPFFSPDGGWVAFYAVPENKLKKIAITGGASITLGDFSNPFGAHWYAEDQILVGQGSKGIVRVPANGGKPETVVTVKADELAQSPQLLPDGETVLFTLASGAQDDRWDKAQVVAHSLRSGQRKVLIEGGSDARYVPTGHIVYALGSTLLAVPFDARRLQVTGGPVPIAEGILRSSSVNTGAVFFDFSRNGSFVSIPGGTANAGNPVMGLALISRTGERTQLNLPPAPYYQPRLSPDGKQMAVEVNDGPKDTNIWIYELAGTTSMRRLTFAGRNRAPLWTRDGQRVVFRSDREGDDGLFWQRADGSGMAERLTTSDKEQFHQPESWSPDGKVLTFYSRDRAANIRMLSLDGDRKPRPLIETNVFANSSSFSPDGRWLAYESGESGRNEVYVQPFPPTSAKYQITTTGAQDPVWSPDGKQLFFLEANTGRATIFSVDIRTQPSFAFGQRTALPIAGITSRGIRGYDITPDGKQFLVMLPPSETQTGDRAALQINVVLNWFSELQQRVPN